MKFDDEIFGYELTRIDCNALCWVFLEIECKLAKSTNYEQALFLMRKVAYWHGFFDAHAYAYTSEPVKLNIDERKYQYITEQLKDYVLWSENPTLQDQAHKLLKYFQDEHLKHWEGFKE